jgi:hypothetical protein
MKKTLAQEEVVRLRKERIAENRRIIEERTAKVRAGLVTPRAAAIEERCEELIEETRTQMEAATPAQVKKLAPKAFVLPPTVSDSALLKKAEKLSLEDVEVESRKALAPQGLAALIAGSSPHGLLFVRHQLEVLNKFAVALGSSPSPEEGRRGYLTLLVAEGRLRLKEAQESQPEIYGKDPVDVQTALRYVDWRASGCKKPWAEHFPASVGAAARYLASLPKEGPVAKVAAAPAAELLPEVTLATDCFGAAELQPQLVSPGPARSRAVLQLIALVDAPAPPGADWREVTIGVLDKCAEDPATLWPRIMEPHTAEVCATAAKVRSMSSVLPNLSAEQAFAQVHAPGRLNGEDPLTLHQEVLLARGYEDEAPGQVVIQMPGRLSGDSNWTASTAGCDIGTVGDYLAQRGCEVLTLVGGTWFLDPSFLHGSLLSWECPRSPSSPHPYALKDDPSAAKIHKRLSSDHYQRNRLEWEAELEVMLRSPVRAEMAAGRAWELDREVLRSTVDRLRELREAREREQVEFGAAVLIARWFRRRKARKVLKARRDSGLDAVSDEELRGFATRALAAIGRRTLTFGSCKILEEALYRGGAYLSLKGADGKVECGHGATKTPWKSFVIWSNSDALRGQAFGQAWAAFVTSLSSSSAHGDKVRAEVIQGALNGWKVPLAELGNFPPPLLGRSLINFRRAVSILGQLTSYEMSALHAWCATQPHLTVKAALEEASGAARESLFVSGSNGEALSWSRLSLQASELASTPFVSGWTLPQFFSPVVGGVPSGKVLLGAAQACTGGDCGWLAPGVVQGSTYIPGFCPELERLAIEAGSAQKGLHQTPAEFLSAAWEGLRAAGLTFRVVKSTLQVFRGDRMIKSGLVPLRSLPYDPQPALRLSVESSPSATGPWSGSVFLQLLRRVGAGHDWCTVIDRDLAGAGDLCVRLLSSLRHANVITTAGAGPRLLPGWSVADWSAKPSMTNVFDGWCGGECVVRRPEQLLSPSLALPTGTSPDPEWLRFGHHQSVDIEVALSHVDCTLRDHSPAAWAKDGDPLPFPVPGFTAKSFKSVSPKSHVKFVEGYFNVLRARGLEGSALIPFLRWRAPWIPALVLREHKPIRPGEGMSSLQAPPDAS